MSYIEIIKSKLNESEMTASDASRKAFGNPYSLYNFLKKGHVLSVENFEKLCKILDLEFYVGPPRGAKDLNQSALHSEKTELEATLASIKQVLGLPENQSNEELIQAIEALAAGARGGDQNGGDQAMHQAMAELRSAAGVLRDATQTLEHRADRKVREPALDAELAAMRAAILGLSSDAEESRAADQPAVRQIALVELAAAAGGGATDLDERVVGQLAFKRSWLEREGLDPTQCVVIGVLGESMEPTLPDGCRILVARGRRQRRAGRLFVLRTGDGLVVKRLDKDAAGRWLLLSDHPAWSPARWTATTEIIGEVVWAAFVPR